MIGWTRHHPAVAKQLGRGRENVDARPRAKAGTGIAVTVLREAPYERGYRGRRTDSSIRSRTSSIPSVDRPVATRVMMPSSMISSINRMASGE